MPLEFSSAVSASRKRSGSPDQRADPRLYELEDAGPLTKGQSDAVRVRFYGGSQDIRAGQFTPSQIQWGQTVNPWGFGHIEGPPQVGNLLEHGDTFKAPEISSPFDGGGLDAGFGLLAGLLLLNAVKPPDPVPPPNAPAAVPSTGAVATAATGLVNPGNTSGGIGSTILTKPVPRGSRKPLGVDGSNLVEPIFGSALAPLGR